MQESFLKPYAAEKLEWPRDSFHDEASNTLATRLIETVEDVHTLCCSIAWCATDALLKTSSLRNTQRLGDLVVITGWHDITEATTVAQYVQRTWPRCGQRIINALDTALSGRSHGLSYGHQDPKRLPSLLALTRCTDQLGGTSDIQIELGTQRTKIIVVCAGPYLADVLSLLAWFGAACRCSPNLKQNCYTSACLRLSQNAENERSLNADIGYAFHYSQHAGAHGCWWSLVRGASVATRFPVHARPNQERGLELATGVLALLQSYPTPKTPFAASVWKGSWTRTAHTTSGMIWHFVPAKNYGDSYLEDPCWYGTKSKHPLASTRHFVGWTVSAQVIAGKFDRLSIVLSSN